MSEKVLVIRNEDDVFDFLRGLVERPRDSDTELETVEFEGWPVLHVRLQGEKFDSTITPKLMHAFLELQKAINRSYSLAAYGRVKRLSDEERELLQIRVKVSKGSSDLKVDMTKLLGELAKVLGDKMEPVHIITTVSIIAAAWAGQSIARSYFENRAKIRQEELRSKDQAAGLEGLKFLSQQDKEKLELITNVAKRDPRINDYIDESDRARSELLKGFAEADKAELDGVEITGEQAETLSGRERARSSEDRLDGVYRAYEISSRDPTKFKVRVIRLEDNVEFDASVQETSLSRSNKDVLKAAIFDRVPVSLKINARRLRGEIVDAVIMDARKVDEED